MTAATAAGADPAPRILPDAAQTAAAAERARRGLALATAELGALQREASRLTQDGLADPADETLTITEHQRWVLYEGLPDLRAGAQEAQRRRAAVQRAYDEASEHLHRQRQVIAREIISDARLVATTLTQLTLRPWLTKADFDHVVVDEAAAAPLPHVAHAVGYAMTGAVLVGDYLQNGPIVDKSFPGGDEVRDLFETNCFSFFDATLQSMVSAGRASRVDANSLLGMFDTESPPPDTPEADLVAALDPYVRVAGVHDEDTAIDEVITRIDQARTDVWCWSAWVGRHADGIIDTLCRAHQRGVPVHVMARPEGEVHEDNRESLSRLVARMPRVVFMQRMHQKIVVVDRQWSIVGSMNMLSHGPTSARRIRDIMFTMDGARFADRLLRQELADELGQIRQCPTCSRTLTECGLVGSGADRGWSWICTADRTHRLKFPSAGAPYDQRRNDRRRT